MAYDQGLAARIRAHLDGRQGVSEKAMFGGLCFLRDGKMFAGIVGDELMARVGPEAHAEALARPHVRVMDFTGRPMRGYVFVAAEGLDEEAALGAWLDRCEKHVAGLPETKAGKKATPRRAKRRKRRSVGSVVPGKKRSDGAGLGRC